MIYSLISDPIFGLCFHLVISQFFIPSQSLDFAEECKNTEDSHLTQGIFTCCSESPDRQPLISSLDFQSGWQRCAIEPQYPNEDPVISAWRVYRCIVFSGLRGKSLKPTTFANLITPKYPISIKERILSDLSELEEEGAKFEVDIECLRRTPYPKVHLVRNLFYNAEQDICEENDSFKQTSLSKRLNRTTLPASGRRSKPFAPLSSPDFASILCDTCERSSAVYHRNGDCCSNVPLPFSFLYLPVRYANSDKVGQCTEDLVDDIGLPSDTTFATKLKYLCKTSCEYHLSGVLSENDIWSGPTAFQSQSNLRSLVTKMMPKYFAPRWRTELQSFIIGNFQNAWAVTPTFESRIKLSQRDIRNCDKGKLKNLLSSCKAHRLVETMANTFLTRFCEEEYDENYPSSNNGTLPVPSGSSSSSSSEEDVTEITLEFDWRRGITRNDDDLIENRMRNYRINRHRNRSLTTYQPSGQDYRSKSAKGSG